MVVECYKRIHDKSVLFSITSRCHGNGCLNNDSKSLRSIPIASRMILNPVDVRGRQSAHDNKSHTRMLQVECT